MFTTVMADPGWQYRDALRMSKTKRSSIDQYKTTMTVDEICALYTPSRVEIEESFLPGKKKRENYIPGKLFGQFELHDTGFLWLWCTPTTLLDGSAQRVCLAWGYEPKQIGVWIKGRCQVFQPRDGAHGNAIDVGLVLQIGMGWATRGAVEFFIIATRGKYTSLVKDKGQSNVILAEEDLVLLASKREHSRKPDEIYDKIESVCPGPYLELFARSGREGWTSYGDELPSSEAVAEPMSAPSPERPPIPIHTLLIVDDGQVEEHHDVLPDPGLDGQWPTS